MCLRFADLERKLGEIDRARAIYAHCSQICDPRVSSLSCIEITQDYLISPCTCPVYYSKSNILYTVIIW